MTTDHSARELTEAAQETTPSKVPASFDARDWAKEFNTIAVRLGYSEMDEGWLIGWFANALMRGYDETSMKAASHKTIGPNER